MPATMPIQDRIKSLDSQASLHFKLMVSERQVVYLQEEVQDFLCSDLLSPIPPDCPQNIVILSNTFHWQMWSQKPPEKDLGLASFKNFVTGHVLRSSS